jgi:hypothetical protein
MHDKEEANSTLAKIPGAGQGSPTASKEEMMVARLAWSATVVMLCSICCSYSQGTSKIGGGLLFAYKTVDEMAPDKYAFGVKGQYEYGYLRDLSFVIDGSYVGYLAGDRERSVFTGIYDSDMHPVYIVQNETVDGPSCFSLDVGIKYLFGDRSFGPSLSVGGKVGLGYWGEKGGSNWTTLYLAPAVGLEIPLHIDVSLEVMLQYEVQFDRGNANRYSQLLASTSVLFEL